MAPQAGAMATEAAGEIKVPGDQTAFSKTLTFTAGTLGSTTYKDGWTTYKLNDIGVGVSHHISVKYGEFGETNKVFVK